MNVVLRKRTVWLGLALCLCAFVPLCLPASAGEVGFAAKPTAAKDGDKVKIAFAVSAPTDVAVYVENAKGDAVRHLAAGVLGPKAPAPFKADSLKQEIEWDGQADYGKPAEGGPFKVRVALGLGARYDRILSSNRQDFININALGTGPDGTLYVLAMSNGAVWSGPQIIALNRDGSYQRMIMPYPTSLKKDQVKGITSFEIDGRPAPLMSGVSMGLYPAFHPVPSTNIAVSPDGSKLLILCASHGAHVRPSLCLLGSDGGTPAEPITKLVGLPGDRTILAGFSCTAVSSDGASAFLGGVQPEPYKPDVQPAVYRVKLPERAPAEPLFGDPAKPGKDESHLGSAPHGLAVDGKGNLFVADHANDRVVVVSEKDGKFVGEFPATKPDFLAVSAKTGAVYVSNRKGGQVEIVKYTPEAGFKGAKEVCRIAVNLSRNDTHSVAVDCSAEPAVGWVCDRFGNLIRFEDRGAKFGDAVKISKGLDGYGSLPESYMGVVVDRQRKEVYTRNSTGGGLYYRFSEDTGKREEIRVPGDAFGGGKGFQIAPGADGNLYGLRWPYCMYKWDRSGKPLKWEKPIRPGEDETKFNKEPQQKSIDLGPEVSFVPVSMTELPHTLGVRWSDGHLFAFTFKVRGRVPKCLHEYLTTGEQVTKQPIIWMTSDAVVGPKFDAAGNIYVAEVVKPKGWQPPELAEHFAKTGVKGLAGPAYVAANMYGSIVKFGPKGGTFDLGDARMIDYFGTKGANPFDGDLKLPEGLKTMEAEFLMGDRMRPAKVVGAEWMHPGIGHVGMYGCNCENVTFDVDEFGRVFFPDPELFRFRVIDTGGNAITHLGGYGNAESMGPDSPVIDPKTGKLRARGAEDPKDLKSPFAEPEIAFAWIVGVGVTDKYIYTGDALNRRMMRLKMTYAAEESCEVK
jgi:DNA-binding beta-propeller fold protein YncE